MAQGLADVQRGPAAHGMPARSGHLLLTERNPCPRLQGRQEHNGRDV